MSRSYNSISMNLDQLGNYYLIKGFLDTIIFQLYGLNIVLEQRVFRKITFLSFEDNKVLKIVNWIC